MAELIDRQAAIDAVKDAIIHDEQKYAEDALMSLPSTEPERKKGKWIDDTFCSECGWTYEVEPGFIGSVKQFNFCPNCGADMREDT